MRPISLHQSDIDGPEYYILDVDDIVKAFTQEWHRIVNRGDDREWHPHVSLISGHVFEALKQYEEADLGLQMMTLDIASMTHRSTIDGTQIDSFIATSKTRLNLAEAAEHYGRAIFERIKEMRLYRRGYLPYHFVGWYQGTGNILIQFDSEKIA